MNIDRPHEIVPGSVLDKLRKELGPMREPRFVPLLPEEAERLRDASEDERAEFLADLPSWERLARFLEREDAPAFMVERARAKHYSDFDSTLTTPCVQLIKDAKALNLYRVVNAAKQGLFDATKKESDDWAARQTGEVKDIIDGMGLA
jgi:hypothetical protein